MGKTYIYYIDVIKLKSFCLILVQLAYILTVLCRAPILSDFLTRLRYCSVFLAFRLQYSWLTDEGELHLFFFEQTVLIIMPPIGLAVCFK